MVEPLRIAAPDEAMIREEAGVFTASSLRRMYLSLVDMNVQLLQVLDRVQAPTEAAFVPVGAAMLYSDFADPPLGSDGTTFLVADGRAILRADHVALNSLYAVQGYPFGSGDGSLTFNIPDNRDRFPIGIGPNHVPAIGATGGDFDHVHLLTDVPEHTHTVSEGVGHTHGVNASGSSSPHNHTAGALTGPSHNHGYSLLQHQHNDSFSLNQGAAHDHAAQTQGGNLTFASHGHGTVQQTRTRNHTVSSGSGITIANLESAGNVLTGNFLTNPNTQQTGGNVQGNTGTRSTNVTIGGSVGNVSGSLPSGTTGNSGTAGVGGSTANATVSVSVSVEVIAAVTGLTIDNAGSPTSSTDPANPPFIGWTIVVRVL